ncbi:DRB0094 family RNA ligase [Apiospora phragmitis]|uniref:DRB0094 family RNA ligase n=1 Tax=Apiospora phragmitis TaxID=2905665 RepID=A0ABR1TWQ8_9PEZI
MTRNLVSVRQISHLEPTSRESNTLLLAHVDGWKCAVKPGTAEVGAYIVYFEINSFLLAKDTRFAELGKSNSHNGNLITWNGQFGFHVRSTKQEVALSQGLIMPLASFPEITKVIAELEENNTKEKAMQKVMGMSFEAELKVLKWEHAPATENSLGQPPSFFPATKIKRVQNCPNLFTPKYKDAVYQESVKLNGSAKPSTSSIVPLPGRFGVCTSNNDLPEKPGCHFWEAALFYGLPKKLASLGQNLAIQGELCGFSICQNREGFAVGKYDFYVYRIFDIDTQAALGPRETEQKAQQLGLKHVPVNGYFRLHDIATSREDLLQRAEGAGIFGKPREGLVYKNLNLEDGRSFKVISNAYLIGNGE